MGAKTTSGSGFLLRFVFSTLDLVDLAQNLKKILRNLGSKVQKFKNYLSELQKLFTREFLTFCGTHAPLSLCRIWLESVEIFRVKRPVACFRTLFFFSRRFAGQITQCHVWRPISPELTISGGWNLEHLLSIRSTTGRIQDIAPIDLPVGRAPPQKSGKNRNFRKLSRVWPALGENVSGVFAQGGYML